MRKQPTKAECDSIAEHVMKPLESQPPIRSKDGLDLPPITQQEMLVIDGTPDAEYPLRILLAYRENCNSKFFAVPPHPLWDRMNADQDERAKLLDEAIATLRRSNGPD